MRWPPTLALTLLAPAAAAPATAQTIQFLPTAAFHLTAEHLSSSEDARFTWDTNFGGDLDVVDYGVGRASVKINYQAILGDEFRPFDPNQGNYTLAAATSVRVPGGEIAGVFHHVSRHLSDRPKREAIDWNMLGVRVLTERTAGRTRLFAHADLRGVVQHSFVDYRWEFAPALRAEWTLRPGVTAHASGALRVVGVDGTRDRDTQTGARGEGGMRLDGSAGAVELFLAIERRVDPSPLEFSTATWVGAGFRILSR